MVFGTKTVSLSTIQLKLNTEKPPCDEQPLWADLNEGANGAQAPTMRLFATCETGATTGECCWTRPAFKGFGPT